MANKIIIQGHEIIGSPSLDSDDVKEIVQEELITNTLSDATNKAPTVALVNQLNQSLANNTVTTHTLNTSVCSGTVRSCTRGNVCYVSFALNITSNITSDTYLASNLPKTLMRYDLMFVTNTGNRALCYIDNFGSLMCSSCNSDIAYGSFSYPVQ